MTKQWREELDERQHKELAFAEVYASAFAHGTDGHHRLLLIAKLAHLLDVAYGMTVEAKSSEHSQPRFTSSSSSLNDEGLNPPN